MKSSFGSTGGATIFRCKIFQGIKSMDLENIVKLNRNDEVKVSDPINDYIVQGGRDIQVQDFSGYQKYGPEK